MVTVDELTDEELAKELIKRLEKQEEMAVELIAKVPVRMGGIFECKTINNFGSLYERPVRITLCTLITEPERSVYSQYYSNMEQLEGDHSSLKEAGDHPLIKKAEERIAEDNKSITDPAYRAHLIITPHGIYHTQGPLEVKLANVEYILKK